MGKEKVRKKNSLKDFVSVAGPLGVTHFLVFSKTETNVNFKFVRVPRGPTLHFKVAQYSLVKDVVSSLKKHRMHEKQFAFPPLLVLNNFGTQGMHVKVMATMFQNMFPSINVHKVHLNSIRRCILISYNQDTQLLDFRHYSVKVVPVGMSKGVKKLLQEKFPNMSRWEDISELLVKGANLSESEAEQDGEHNITELPQVYAGRGNQRFEQSAVRLTEIGPRMTLQLVKIEEEGLNDGKVLYHNYIKKTEEEIMAMLDRREKKLKQKSERKKKQEQNVKRKKAMNEENKKRSLAGMKRKRPEDEDDEVEDPGEQDPADVSEDDDVEYYRQTVGEEPDKDLFLHGKKRKSLPKGKSGPPQKRFKKDPMKQSDASPSPSGHHTSKFSLRKGPKSPKGQSPRPDKKGQKSFRNFEGPKGQSPRSPKGQKQFRNFDGPKGQSPRPDKQGKKPFRKFEGPKGQSPRSPKGQKQFRNFDGPKGQSPRPDKKGNKQFRNFEGPKGQSPRSPKGQKQFRNFDGPKGQSPRPDKKGKKQFRNFEGPKGQSPRPGKKGQKPFKNNRGRTQNEHPTGKGKKMGFKKPGAFGSKDQNKGKKDKVAGGRKMGGPKGKAFRHKKKSP
ncbi:unnamed protein product [Ranitomeya imitator]|uniref:Brix domain-containing protein n=1 Tax=Ranitomeya imitator TaxID=111125 RepID=A0ABN9LT79_9NEOB|nr:unnamed protein product [Ranitomeya imitator]